MRMGRGTLGVAALVTGCLLLTACGFPAVCPAIGYVSTIIVNLEGEIARVDEVMLCTPEGCSEPGPVPAPPGPKKTAATPDVTSEPGPRLTAPPVTRPPFRSRKVDPDTWEFTVSTNLPKRVTVRALNSAGAVLAEQENNLQWIRVGGSEQCGGPMTTQPITLRITR